MLDYLKRIWTGTATKKEHLTYFFSAFGIYLLGIIIAASLYPGEFSMTTVYISYLGGYPNNPDGYMFYNICEIIAGVLFAAHFIFLYKRLVPALKIVAFVACVFGIIGSLGFASIGIYYQGSNALGHQITTWLAFGGFGGSALLLIPVLIRKMCLKHNWPSVGSFLAAYGVTIGIGVLAVLLENYGDWFISLGLDPGYTSGKFTEWLYMFVVIAWLFGTAIIAKDPANVREIEDEEIEDEEIEDEEIED